MAWLLITANERCTDGWMTNIYHGITSDTVFQSLRYSGLATIHGHCFVFDPVNRYPVMI